MPARLRWLAATAPCSTAGFSEASEWFGGGEFSVSQEPQRCSSAGRGSATHPSEQLKASFIWNSKFEFHSENRILTGPARALEVLEQGASLRRHGVQPSKGARAVQPGPGPAGWFFASRRSDVMFYSRTVAAEVHANLELACRL